MKKVTIYWAGAAYTVPTAGGDYKDYSLGSAVRRALYNLEGEIAEVLGGIRPRDLNPGQR